jgi:hypothetical protein
MESGQKREISDLTDPSTRRLWRLPRDDSQG